MSIHQPGLPRRLEHPVPVSALVVGEALVDITQRSGEDRTVRPGGAPLNVAVGLARLGVPVLLATQLGSDRYGAQVQEHVEASGVDLLRLPPEHATASATAVLDDEGRADYEFDLRWDPTGLPDPVGRPFVHLGSIGATLRPGAELVCDLAAASRGADVPVSFDPNLRMAITPDGADVADLVEAICRRSWLVKLSDEDATVLWPGRPPAEVLSHLLDLGPRLVAMTRGGDGALMASASGSVAREAPSVEIADTIGAGDSFMAALLAALTNAGLLGADDVGPGDLTWLVDVAVTAAALTCSRPGADPPWRPELPVLTGVRS